MGTLSQVTQKKTERMCLVSRIVLPISKMMRFVLSPGNEVVYDIHNNLPGRGVWIERDILKVKEALKKKAFQRGFKEDISESSSLLEMIDYIFMREFCQSLSLANKAGMLIPGFTKVEAALMNKSVAALIHAKDAAEDGCRKLNNYARNRFGNKFDQFPIIEVFSREELDRLLNRFQVTHIAVLSGIGSNGLLKNWCHFCDYYGKNVSSSVEKDNNVL